MSPDLVFLLRVLAREVTGRVNRLSSTLKLHRRVAYYVDPATGELSRVLRVDFDRLSIRAADEFTWNMVYTVAVPPLWDRDWPGDPEAQGRILRELFPGPEDRTPEAWFLTHFGATQGSCSLGKGIA